MTQAQDLPQRVKRHGRFAFEGVSFGYTYWEPREHECFGAGRANKTDSVIAENKAKFSNSPFAHLPGYGSSGPFVLVHGFGQSAQSWDSVVPFLDPVRPVWAFELMGHGSSDRPISEAFYDLEFQGRALLAFLEALACGNLLDESVSANSESQKITLIGYSMGGRVVLSAIASPKRFAQVVSEVVLESAGLGAPSLEARVEAARKDSFHADKLREDGLEAFFDYWETLPLFASQTSLPRAARQAIRAERLRNDPQALAVTFERAGQHCMPLRSEVYERLRTMQTFGVGVDYLVGAEDSKYVALAQEAAQAIALSVTEVPGCGHNVHSELVAGAGR